MSRRWHIKRGVLDSLSSLFINAMIKLKRNISGFETFRPDITIRQVGFRIRIIKTVILPVARQIRLNPIPLWASNFPYVVERAYLAKEADSSCTLNWWILLVKWMYWFPQTIEYTTKNFHSLFCHIQSVIDNKRIKDSNYVIKKIKREIGLTIKYINVHCTN